MLTCARCGTANPDGFRFCGNCAAPLEAPPVASAERRKVVTVLFADVAGSTRLGEQLDPESLRAIMGRYFETVRTVLERHGGTVEKFIGDAVMAVFGHPVLHEDDPLRAVRAAAELREALGQLNEQLARDWGVAIETRIGVNTGQVVAGEARVGETLVTGDAVNVAARLQTAAEPGETLIGHETYGQVRDAVTVDELTPLILKGKQLPVPAWRLVSVARDALGHTRRLDSPLVGRQRERRLLDEAFGQAVVDRTCVLFTLLGAAGVGKSRLVHEFVTGVRESARVLRGRCLPYGEGITYWPLAEVVKEAVGIRESDSTDGARLAIQRACAADPQGRTVAAHVAAAIGLADESGVGDELFWGIRRFLELLAAEQPLVLVFDDVHWAEPTFLDLLEHIADWSRDASILLLCVARPELLEALPGWAGGKLRATTLLLESLSSGDVVSLVGNLLGESGLAQTVVDRVAEVAEGNPLFVEEFVAMLIDDGVLSQESGRWVPQGNLETVKVPSSIRSLLAARIDRLAAPERRVIERASVVGKVFWRGAVAELAPEPMRPEVGPSLLGLVRKELVRPDRSDFAGDDAFRFRHLLIRDAAYDALPKNERVSLHERFAGWLERTAGDRVIEYQELIGYHLEQAYRYRAELGPLDEPAVGLARRAAELLGAAGQRAADRGDVAAARTLLVRATGMLPTADPQRIGLLRPLGDALGQAGMFDEAKAVLSEAIAGAERSGRTGDRWRARLRQIDFGLWSSPEGAAQVGLRDAQAAIAALEPLGDERGLAEAWNLVSEVDFYLGRLRDERAALERALVHARSAGYESMEVRILVSRAAIGVWDDTPLPDAIRESELALERSRAAGRRVAEASSLGILGRLRAMGGEIDEGRQLVADGRAMLRDLGRRVHAAGGSHWAATVEWEADDPVAVEAVLRDGIAEFEAVGERAMLSSSLAELALALQHQGRGDEAARAADRTRELAASDDLAAQSVWRLARARVLADQGRLDEAARLADEAVGRFDASEYAVEKARARLEVSELVERVRGRAAARTMVQEALAIAEHKQLAPMVAALRGRLAELS